MSTRNRARIAALIEQVGPAITAYDTARVDAYGPDGERDPDAAGHQRLDDLAREVASGPLSELLALVTREMRARP
ncbi:MAG: hypothetical protein L0I76_23105 [Pseudonocardia sp.]|nr:hypothetical protein [Pseudonocardia sp.]